jgi:hypothetical protein
MLIVIIIKINFNDHNYFGKKNIVILKLLLEKLIYYNPR